MQLCSFNIQTGQKIKKFLKLLICVFASALAYLTGYLIAVKTRYLTCNCTWTFGFVNLIHHWVAL